MPEEKRRTKDALTEKLVATAARTSFDYVREVAFGNPEVSTLEVLRERHLHRAMKPFLGLFTPLSTQPSESRAPKSKDKVAWQRIPQHEIRVAYEANAEVDDVVLTLATSPLFLSFSHLVLTSHHRFSLIIIYLLVPLPLL